MKKQIQQGDVTLMRVDSAPSNGVLIKPSPRGHVLAEGEVTGHAHVVPVDHATMTKVGAKLYLTITAPTKVTHEEHGPIDIEPGVWEIGRVREFDYLSMMARTVAD